MATFQQISEFLVARQDELVEVLDADKQQRFKSSLAKLERDWPTLPNDDVRMQITMNEIHKYPNVWKTLEEKGLLSDTLATTPSQARATLAVDEDAEEPQSVRTRPNKEKSQHVGAVRNKEAAVKGDANEQLSLNVADRIAIMKELITGITGICIVLVTLTMVVTTVFTVGNAETHAAVKDALLFMNGLVGVVLGYYFGRTPADARANQAESLSRTAQHERDRVLTTVRTVLDSDSASSFSRGSDEVHLTREQVENLQHLLRQYGA